MAGGAVGAVGGGGGAPAAAAASSSVSSSSSSHASSSASVAKSSAAASSNSTKVTLSNNAKAASQNISSELRGMTPGDDPTKNIKLEVGMPKKQDDQNAGVAQAMAAYAAAATLM